MDAAGPEQAAKFYQQAGVSFARGVDRADALWDTMGFQVVPNGVFLDEAGIVRYAKFGGFEARSATDVAEIERLLAAPPAPAAAAAVARETLAASDVAASARHWFRLGIQALEKGDKGDKEAAAGHWRKALALDPANFVIRKQIWALEHPEQFYPKINFDWQREQLALERKQNAP